MGDRMALTPDAARCLAEGLSLALSQNGFGQNGYEIRGNDEMGTTRTEGQGSKRTSERSGREEREGRGKPDTKGGPGGIWRREDTE